MGRIAIILLALVIIVDAVFTHRSIQNLCQTVEEGFIDMLNQMTVYRQSVVVSEPLMDQVDESANVSFIDYEVIRDIVQDVVRESVSDRYAAQQFASNRNPAAYQRVYDPDVVQDMKYQADTTLDAAVDTGIWTQESADAFYSAVERLPEEERFEYYVKHSAALNSGKLVLPVGGDPSLLLR